MAQQIINSDSQRPFGPTNGGISTEFGDTWDSAVAKLNAMFAELYDAIAITPGSGLELVGGTLSIASGGVTNAMLANSAIVLGTTVMSLGNTYSSISGNLSFGGTVNFTGPFEIGGVPVTLPVSVPNGGTGVASLTANGVLYGGGTGSIGATGINGTATKQFLSQTNGFAPSWNTIAAADVPASALTATGDTNVTITLGGSPGGALLAASSITLGWSGQLALARGGTGANLSATGGTSQVLKQASTGAAITVGQLAFADLSGDIAVSQMNSGSGASSTTFWRGDGSWASILAADLPSDLDYIDVPQTFSATKTFADGGFWSASGVFDPHIYGGSAASSSLQILGTSNGSPASGNGVQLSANAGHSGVFVNYLGNVGLNTSSPATPLHAHFGANQNLIGESPQDLISDGAALLSLNDALNAFQSMELHATNLVLRGDNGISLYPGSALAAFVTTSGQFDIGTTLADPGAYLNLSRNAHSPPLAPGGVDCIHVTAADGNAATYLADSFAQTAYQIFRRANGTCASPSAVAAGSAVAAIDADSFDGTAYSTIAQIEATAFNTQSTSDHSSYLSFLVTEYLTTALTEQLRLMDDGTLNVGNAVLGNRNGGGIYVQGPSHFKGGKPWADVYAWGATGNGSNDDTSAIQNAINYVYTTFGGGFVLLPPGNFYVTSTLTVKGGVILLGAGANASSISATTDLKIIEFDSTCSYAGLEKLTVTGYQNSAATANLIHTSQNVLVNIRDVRAFGGNFCLQDEGIDGVRDNCYFSGWGTNGGCVTIDGANWYLRTKFDTSGQTTQYGISIAAPFSGATSAENHFDMCDFSGSFTDAIQIAGANSGSPKTITTFTGCVIGSPVNISTAQITMFDACEVGTTSFTVGTNPTLVTGCAATGSACTISGAGKTVSGCYNIS